MYETLLSFSFWHVHSCYNSGWVFLAQTFVESPSEHLQTCFCTFFQFCKTMVNHGKKTTLLHRYVILMKLDHQCHCIAAPPWSKNVSIDSA